jgi:hypothetical protein
MGQLSYPYFSFICNFRGRFKLCNLDNGTKRNLGFVLGLAREREEKLWLLKTCGKRFCGRLVRMLGFERSGGLKRCFWKILCMFEGFS